MNKIIVIFLFLSETSAQEENQGFSENSFNELKFFSLEFSPHVILPGFSRITGCFFIFAHSPQSCIHYEK